MGELPDRESDGMRVDGFLFESRQMRRLLGQLHSVAPLEATILLLGETGTGKTHLARAIHELSLRRARPFRVVHCGALAPSLLESELFGHARGAFTGADADRIGKLAEVEDGTLLLDEIDCIPLESQVKLLRAMEERVFEPIGSNVSRSLRARLIVATNRALEAEVAAKRFRADLYFRFNVVSLCLAPLREQPELVRPLTAKFLAEFNARYVRQVLGLSGAAFAALETYDWPGNVRELRNVIERAVALCCGTTIDMGDLPVGVQRCCVEREPRLAMVNSVPRNRLDWARQEAELSRLIEALDRHGNNRTNAAAELGISRVTLYKKLRRYGLA